MARTSQRRQHSKDARSAVVPPPREARTLTTPTIQLLRARATRLVAVIDLPVLDAEEQRLLGALLEKQRTVPASSPSP